MGGVVIIFARMEMLSPVEAGRIARGLRTGKKYRGVEQLVARMVHTHEVAGSNPAPATRKGEQKGKVDDGEEGDGVQGGAEID